MNYKNEFQVQQLRTKNLTAATESIAVFIAAVVANMLVPQLLLKYVYDPATLFEAPPIFEYLPLGLYGFALIYFIIAMIGNFRRGRQARKLEQEIMLSDAGCCDGDCSCDSDEISEEELKELERIVDEALKPAKKTTKKKVASKTKATKKKTATKTKKAAKKKKTTKKSK